MPSATVYIIDDDPAILKSLTRLLTVEGFQVVTFGSAPDFLAASIPSQTMCVLVDLRMPGMTGFDLLQELHLAGRNFPVILMTGHANDSVLENALARNVITLLSKPFESAALFAAVREGLARDRERRLQEHQSQ
jgi:two-component system response regulator FixJ